ncbi:hypothetical protein [Pseudoalteromonas sp. S2893]|uniref:hypothetical protein n=1 Tax=Pseudoalteromonas sp. S2893 TaxID=579530 RepID=UPI001486B132|nr:hypothetical protein [Pseudoalteromonas sp. S2893]
MNKPLPVTHRHYFHDWLRVIAVAVLNLYHLGMLFSENWGFHYKSTYISHYVEYY